MAAALLTAPLTAHGASSSSTPELQVQPIDQAELFYKYALSTFAELTYDDNIAHPPGPDDHLGVGDTVIHAVIARLPGLGRGSDYAIKTTSDFDFSGPGGVGAGGTSYTFSLSTGVIFVNVQKVINGTLSATSAALLPPKTSGLPFAYLDALAAMAADLSKTAAPADAAAYLQSVSDDVRRLTSVDDLSLCQDSFRVGERLGLGVCYATSVARDVIISVTRGGQVVLSGRAHLPSGSGKAVVDLVKVVPDLSSGFVDVVATLVPVNGRVESSLVQRKSTLDLELR